MEFEEVPSIREAEKCSKCNGSGIVKDEDGSVHVCYECLEKGRLDVHSKDLKDSGLRI